MIHNTDRDVKDNDRGARNFVIDNKGYVKGVWLYVLAVVVIVVLGGYGLYMNRSLDKKVEDLGSKVETPTGTSASSDTSSKSRSFEAIHKGIRGFSEEKDNSNVPQTKADKLREHFNRGLRYSFSKDYDKAIKEFEEVLKLNPNSAEAYNNIGFAYFDKGDIDNAIIQHKKALEVNPKLANAYYGLALAYEKKDKVQDAITNWDKYIELAPPGTVWVQKAKERRDKLQGLEEKTRQVKP